MPTVKRSWDLLTDDQRREAINEIIGFFKSERNEVIGIIAAEELLDMFLQATSAHIYNKGVEDTKNFLQNGLCATIIDIEANLKK